MADFFVLYLGIGALAGMTAGLLGVGGGSVTVPLLLWVFGLEGIDPLVATHVALATSLAAMVFTSVSSTLAHAGKGAVMWRVFLLLATGVLIGSVAGVGLAVEVSGTALQIAFAIFLSYVALQMIIGFSPKPGRRLPSSPGLVGSGGVIGGVSMFFGIGGGSLTVPLLSYCGVSPVRAVGTSAAVGLPIALWGSLLYVFSGWGNPMLPEHSFGYVYWPAVLGIVPASVLFAKLGATIAHRLRADQLRIVFGGVLLLIAAEMLMSNIL